MQQLFLFSLLHYEFTITLLEKAASPMFLEKIRAMTTNLYLQCQTSE